MLGDGHALAKWAKHGFFEIWDFEQVISYAGIGMFAISQFLSLNA